MRPPSPPHRPLNASRTTLPPPPGALLGTRHLIGVSGGLDSVVLLDWLVQAGGRKLVVCHLNHQLRGRAAAADAAFVARLAARHGLPCELGRTDVAALAKVEGLSLEAAGRLARTRFFQSVARRRRCPRVLLAHHADDQVETLLLNLGRGAGLRGLAGMRPASTRDGLTFLRPLLATPRSDLEAWAAARRLKWREDATNDDPAFTRNRLRHELIPLFHAVLGRDIRPALLRTAELAAADEDWLDSLLPPPAATLPVAALRAAPLALQRRQIRAWLLHHGVPGIGWDEVEAVRSLLPPGAAQCQINLPAARHVRRTAGQLRVLP